MNIVKRLVAASAVMCGITAFSATECVWVGGESGIFSEETNWSNGIKPSSNTSIRYAVFTNSVDLTLDVYWYPGGIVVSNNAEVTVTPKTAKDHRCRPSSKIDNDEFPITVETGSSLKFNGTYLFSTGARTLIKEGGGLLWTTYWCGNSSSTGSYWNNVDIRGGTLKFPSGGPYTCITNALHIRSGATAIFPYHNPFATRNVADEKNPYIMSEPRVEIEAGGVLDVSKKNIKISSLSGAGAVSNCTATLTMMLRDSGEIFSGEILGGGTLAITPDEYWTAPDAEWIVGSATALNNVTLERNTLEGFDYEVKFLPGVHTFYMYPLPELPQFDTNGVPVEIARSGNFWYVDCNRTGEAGDGKSLETAFQTLAEAMTNPRLAYYDTVWVAPGVYSNGTMQSENGLQHRVSVPSKVRLVSLEGPEKTVITGEDSPEPIDEGYGCGTNAVRCVKLAGDTTLRGFTLRDGRVYAKEKAGQGDSNIGGGIYANVSAVIIDCVISNCVACRGGGVYRGNYFNCRFYANRAIESNVVGAHVFGYANLYNCVLRGAPSGCDWYVNNSGIKVVNCTFDYNPSGGIRGLKAEDSENENTGIFNSLVFSSPFEAWPDEYENSIVSPQGKLPAGDGYVVTNLTSKTVPTVYQFAGIFPDTLKPRKWKSRAVDAADAERYQSLFPVAQYYLSIYDADFKPRIHDGRVDLGAFSFDRSTPYPSLKITIR